MLTTHRGMTKRAIGWVLWRGTIQKETKTIQIYVTYNTLCFVCIVGSSGKKGWERRGKEKITSDLFCLIGREVNEEVREDEREEENTPRWPNNTDGDYKREEHRDQFSLFHTRRQGVTRSNKR